MMPNWITRGLVGIILATFFSDVGHEMVTAVLPLYLGSIGLGAAALGAMEGLADLLGSLSKLAGGIVGHHLKQKRPLTTLGYLVTAIGTGAIAFAHSLSNLLSLRSLAWIGRGFRSPLRDYMLSDEVDSIRFARAYGIERTADMLGAVLGPLIAALLVWIGTEYRNIILVSLIPSFLAAASIFFMTRDRPQLEKESSQPGITAKTLPGTFWWFLGGVMIFGLGDFSRTFLIFLAAKSFGHTGLALGGMSIAVLLYAFHNVVSAIVAYPAGWFGDRMPKGYVLAIGYALGVITNLLFALHGHLAYMMPVIFLLSGTYIAIEETIEKAAVAEMLPRESRTFGFGVLASANAIGDMLASLWIGLMISKGEEVRGFFILSGLGAIGTFWIAYRTHLLQRRQ